MDATNSHTRGRYRRRWRRRRHHRPSQTPSPSPPSSPSSPSPQPEHSEQAQYYDLASPVDEFVENKMGLPPPYEQSARNSAPPPSYFGDNPPPPPGLILPPTVQPRTTVITSPPATAGAPPAKLGPGPTGTSCPHCNKSIVTRVDFVPNNRTHIASAALCVLAGCCCGCIIPYCMRSCKTANHYCPKCRAFVGAYTPS